MRNFITAGLAGALALSLTTPALARTEAKTEAAVEQVAGGAATAGKAEERKVCRHQEMTGTRMKNKRVCLTKAEWAKIEQDEF